VSGRAGESGGTGRTGNTDNRNEDHSEDIARFAESLRRLRERSGRSYAALAGRLHVSAFELRRYCAGDAVPTQYALVERFARLCGASREELAALHLRWPPADAARRSAAGRGDTGHRGTGAAAGRRGAGTAGRRGAGTAGRRGGETHPRPLRVATAARIDPGGARGDRGRAPAAATGTAAAGWRRPPRTRLPRPWELALGVAAALVLALIAADVRSPVPHQGHPATAPRLSPAPTGYAPAPVSTEQGRLRAPREEPPAGPPGGRPAGRRAGSGGPVRPADASPPAVGGPSPARPTRPVPRPRAPRPATPRPTAPVSCPPGEAGGPPPAYDPPAGPRAAPPPDFPWDPRGTPAGHPIALHGHVAAQDRGRDRSTPHPGTRIPASRATAIRTPAPHTTASRATATHNPRHAPPHPAPGTRHPAPPHPAHPSTDRGRPPLVVPDPQAPALRATSYAGRSAQPVRARPATSRLG
jgi:Helix-turn-helix domain